MMPVVIMVIVVPVMKKDSGLRFAIDNVGLRLVVLLNDHGALLDNGVGLRCQSRLLHRVDYRFRDTLLVQADDVVDVRALLNAAGLDLVDDHLLADPVSTHNNDVLKRDALAVKDCLLLLVLITAVVLFIVML